MQENHNTILIAGGKAHCTPAWNRNADEQDQCFKIYFLVGGSAVIQAAGENTNLASGRIYIIDGHRLEKMACPASMDVYWLHFMPESLYFEQVLSAIPAITEIKVNNPAEMHEKWHETIKVFERPAASAHTPHETVPLALSCQAQSLILEVLAGAMKQHPLSENRKRLNAIYRFREIINFMDAHYKQNPSLQDLAKKAGMAPEYFHRQFRKVFRTTPHEYMQRRRMNMAQHLIRKTDVSIKEIATQCGYDNPFYFSRIFTQWLKMTPSEYRQHGTRM